MMKRTKLLPLITAVCIFAGCGASAEKPAKAGDKLEITGELELSYAEMFSVSHCKGGCELITIGEDEFLLVPEGNEVPEGAEGMTVLRQPLSNIYLAASSAMDLFSGLDSLGSVTMTSTEDWSLPEVTAALENEDMFYVGKYSAPDYEFIMSEQCPVAIESTMIYHTPEVKEQLEALGIPVIVEHSSYETHPLGRMEWIKLYGLLLGREEQAERFFAEKQAIFDSMELPDLPEEERKTAAFFYVSPNGYVNVRKPGDYISRMIELAGGRYIFTADDLSVEENALSTMNIQMESFYQKAKDADILIYNSTVGGELSTLEELTALSPVFSDMKAVKSGEVWCTGKNMFQQTTCAAEMTRDLNLIITGQAETTPPTFLHKLT